jgi:predicted 3-demethylubiquinone-9 3-methyltransferase (glyoxalase superfamily)
MTRARGGFIAVLGIRSAKSRSKATDRSVRSTWAKARAASKGTFLILSTEGRRISMQKIRPFLWFDDQAEEAMNFYVSIFKNSKVGRVTRYGDAGPGPKGSVMSATFQLEGQEFFALNGGPLFKFTEAISFFVDCKTQQEVDELWEKLSEGGEKSRCGWLKDKYGLSWQIIPSALMEMLGDKDPKKAARVMQAMLGMGKIEIAGLREAYERD